MGLRRVGYDLTTEQKIFKIKNQKEQEKLLKLKSNDGKLILTDFLNVNIIKLCFALW